MILRSDEIANQAEIERDQRFRSNVNKGVATAATLTGALTGSGIASKIMPFLNKYIPVDLAIKGINKINPKIGDFLRKGQEMGLNVEEGLEYIRDRITPKETQQTTSQEKSKDNRNIIEQYSPELHQFIAQQVASGRSPVEAAAIAQHDKRFSSIINKLSKDHKTPWSSIIDSIYGTGQQGGTLNSQNQPQQEQQKVLQESQGKWDKIAGALQNLLNS